jgi:hypothetical protein
MSGNKRKSKVDPRFHSMDFENPIVKDAISRMKIKSRNHLLGYRSISIEEVKKGYNNDDPEIYWNLMKKIVEVTDEMCEKSKVRNHKKLEGYSLNKYLDENKEYYNYWETNKKN